MAFYFDILVIILPKALSISPFQWNWIGKALEFSWPLIIVFILGWLTPEEVGLKLPKEKSGWLPGLIVGLVFASYAIIMSLLFGDEIPQDKLNLETIFYQMTMPGLAEEIVYRGVFLVILNKYLGRQWKFWGIRFGWGLVLVSILFVLVHIITYSSGEKQIVWNTCPDSILEYLAISFSLGFLREKTGSIWPCVVCHNIVNALPFIVIYNLRT